MKKLIITLAFLLIPTMALAESVNVFGSGDLKIIYTTTDQGDVRSSTAHKIPSGWWIVDDRGNSTMVNDYSSDRDRERDRQRKEER